MKINKYKNLGQGWNGESVRHSNAKKYGIAGGLYAKKIPKTRLAFIVQGNYGQGWEDVTEEMSYFGGLNRLREYNQNEPSPHRIIRRRIPYFELSESDKKEIENNRKEYMSIKYKGLYYAISSISDKGKTDDIISQIRNKLSSEGIKADIYDDKGQIRLKNIRLEKSLNVRDAQYTKSGIRKTNALSWDDWVKVNDSVNDVLDSNDIKATVSSLGGKFKIRNKSTGRFSEDDWQNLQNDSIRRGE